MSPLLALPLTLLATATAAEPGLWLEQEEEIEVVELNEDSGEPWKWCYKQRLRNGVQLPANPPLYIRRRPEEAWGTPEMIEVLTAAAEEMAWVRPEADPIVVGDISTRRGGCLQGHKSHRGGVDADIGLYWGDGRMYSNGFKDVSARDLDAETNWLLIRAMLETGHVERILLDNKLVNKLRRYVIREGHLTHSEAWKVFPTPGTKMWEMDGVVHHSPGHRHHMHVRVFCPVLQ